MLFKKVNELLEYAELTSINFTSVKSTLKMVERQHVLPVLGAVLYKNLVEAYNSDQPLADKHKNLLDLCRAVIGPYLVYYYTPKAEVKLSDAGAQRQETESNKTAYQNQVAAFREQNLREGEQNTEFLLQFLSENNTGYPEWQNTPAHKKYNALFIKSGSEFNELFPSHSPYRNYMAMRPHMEDVEQNDIRPLLGDKLFFRLKASEPAHTTEEKELITRLKKLIAYQAVAIAIPFLNVRMDQNGITVVAPNRAQDDKLSSRASPGTTILQNLTESCRNMAATWRNNVTTYIDANAAAFASHIDKPKTNETQTRTRIFGANADIYGGFGLV